MTLLKRVNEKQLLQKVETVHGSHGKHWYLMSNADAYTLTRKTIYSETVCKAF